MTSASLLLIINNRDADELLHKVLSFELTVVTTVVSSLESYNDRHCDKKKIIFFHIIFTTSGHKYKKNDFIFF